MASSYFLRLDKFEGPLDLLLHLIKVHELDIFDIDLFTLTQQYLEYLRLVKYKDLQDAAAFMEMAASLCEIKSRNLLPGSEEAPVDDNDQLEDPAVSLGERLLEYDRFKKAAEFLGQRPVHGVLIRPSSEWERVEKLFEHIEAPLRGDKNTLLVLYEQMMSTLSERRPVRVKALKETVSVSEVIEKIKKYTEELKFVLFQDLFPVMENRYEFIAYVLGMLQMVRDRQMKIHQESDGGPIWLYQLELESEELPDAMGYKEKRFSRRDLSQMVENTAGDSNLEDEFV